MTHEMTLCFVALTVTAVAWRSRFVGLCAAMMFALGVVTVMMGVPQ